MRLHNLKKEDELRCRAETSFLRKVLEEELTEVKNDLISRPIDHLPELRGQARCLVTIIKLLS